MIKRSLYAIIDLLKGAKSILLYYIWRVGDETHKKFQVSEKNLILFYYIKFFLCY